MILTTQQLEYIAKYANEDTSRLALHQEASLTRDEQLFALQQIAARQRLRDKLPTIVNERRFIFPTRISTEQSSSELTAKFKATLLDEELGKNDTAQRSGVSVDLTGGLGIDSIFMGTRSKRHHYVELNPIHSKAAAENLPLMMNNVEVHNADAETFIKTTEEHFDFIYLDPARRDDGGSKVFMLEDCTPNILGMMPVLRQKSEIVMVKLSPMLDVTQAIEKLRPTRVVVLSVNDECKELIAICHGQRRCKLEAVEINKRGTFRLEETETEGVEQYGLPEAGMVLYEPYAAMMKAGMFSQMAARFGIKMIAKDSHLFFMPYSETAGHSNFPGRGFIITKIEKFNKKSFNGITKANIATRNFPMSVKEIRQRFKVGDGGELYIFCTTDNQGNKLILCCKKIS